MHQACESTAVNGAPVRPDLANVTPLFYPIVEQCRFGSVAALCTRLKWDRATVDEFVNLAALNQSEVIPVGGIDSTNQTVPILVLRPCGGVILCCGLLGEASQERSEVEAIAREFAESKDFRGKFVAIGEFRPNPTVMPN